MDTKIAFFDIDGTLVNVPNGLMHPTNQTIHALNEFKNQGHKIVIATARGEVPQSVQDIEFDGYICSDGHYIRFEGEILIDGHNVKDYSLEYLRNQVGMVLQKNTLFSGTVKENLLWGNKEASDEEIKWACKQACVDEFIENFPEGYDTYLEQGGVNVSGGQKQRLCIARALLKHPKILILDDSTSAVDTATEASIKEALASLKGTTKIIIAQRISSLQHANQIIILDNGKIHAIGNHEELLKNDEIYQEIYDSQLKGVDL